MMLKAKSPTLRCLWVVSLILPSLGITVTAAQGDKAPCPVKELLQKGYVNAASKSCQVALNGNVDVLLETEEALATYTVTVSDQDRTILWTSVVDAINEANNEGDEGFPPFVVEKAQPNLGSEQLESELVESTDPSGLRSLQFNPNLKFKYGYYTNARCYWCFAEDTDGRDRFLVGGKDGEESSSLRSSSGSRQLDDQEMEYTFDDDLFNYSSYDDDDSYNFYDNVTLVSDRLWDKLEASGSLIYSNLTCISISCDGSDFIDSSGPDTSCDIQIEENAPATSAPTSAPPSVVGPFCFSGEAMVEVKNVGAIPMKDLKLGDDVKVHRNTFERVYSFGHHQSHELNEYLLINSVLMISRSHLIAVGDDRGFVPASTLKIGDKLIMPEDSSSSSSLVTVSSIVSKKGKGAFAPFTPSGTIVVDGILVSSFVTMQQDSAELVIGEVSTGITWQWIAHTFEIPHRIVCGGLFMRSNDLVLVGEKRHRHEEIYNSQGISTWVARPHAFAEWLNKQHDAVKVAVWVPMLIILAALHCATVVSIGSRVLVSIGLAMAVASIFVSKNKKYIFY